MGWIHWCRVAEANDDPFARGGLPAGPKRHDPADVRTTRVGRARDTTGERWPERCKVGG